MIDELAVPHPRSPSANLYPSRIRKGSDICRVEGEAIYVRISPERFGEPGLAWRNPFWKPPGAVMRKAPITALADIPALTARIARELKIAPPAQPRLI